MGLCSSRSTERAPGGSSSDTRTTSSAPVDAKSSFQIPAPHWRWIYTHQEAHFCPVKSTPVWILPCFCRTTRINSFFSWFPLICVALSKFTDLQLCMQICCFYASSPFQPSKSCGSVDRPLRLISWPPTSARGQFLYPGYCCFIIVQ